MPVQNLVSAALTPEAKTEIAQKLAGWVIANL